MYSKGAIQMTIAFVLIAFAVVNVQGDSHTLMPITHQEEANERANSFALDVIGNMPRVYGDDSTMDKEDFNGENMEYWAGIASLIAVPLIFVAFSLLCAPLWMICRCCQCCCCKRKEPKNGVSGIQIYAPYAWVLSCMIAIVAMAAIGYGANVDFSGALLYNNGEGEDGNLFGVAETLLLDTSSKMNMIRNITLDLREGTVSAVDGVRDILNDTSILSEGSSSLISMLYGISSLWSGYNVTSEWDGEQYSFECEFCSTFGGAIWNITEEIETQTAPVFQELNGTVNEVEGSLVNVEGDILNQTDVFIETVTEVRDYVVDIEDDVAMFREQLEHHNEHRELAYNIIFAVPLVSIIYLLFGGILKQAQCFTLAYCYLWFSCTLMWALLAVHLPIAVLLNDSCDFLDVVEQDVTDTINGTNGQVAVACLNGDPLVEALGLSSYLNFTEVITFPSLGNISQHFEFEQLDDFEDDAFTTNFTTFYSEGDDALLTINNLTAASMFADGHHWARHNISALNATSYYPSNNSGSVAMRDTLDGLQGLMMAEAASISSFNDTVFKIRSNLSSVNEQAFWLQQTVQELAVAVENASFLLDPLFDSVHDMEEHAECAFVGDAYRDTKAVMCSSVLGSLSRIVVAMFVIAVLSMVGCCWTIQLVRRVHWWQEQKRQEKDDKLQQSMQPKKPNVIFVQQRPSEYGYNGPQV